MKIPNNNKEEKSVDSDLVPKDVDNYTQVCVIQGMLLDGLDAEGFKQYVADNFDGVRVNFLEEVKTNPDVDSEDEAIPETGGRNDIFFNVHTEDIARFAVKRLGWCKWWEDVHYNGQTHLYPQEILNKYPKTW
jgi:hypothetical protein